MRLKTKQCRLKLKRGKVTPAITVTRRFIAHLSATTTLKAKITVVMVEMVVTTVETTVEVAGVVETPINIRTGGVTIVTKWDTWPACAVPLVVVLTMAIRTIKVAITIIIVMR